MDYRGKSHGGFLTSGSLSESASGSVESPDQAVLDSVRKPGPLIQLVPFRKVSICILLGAFSAGLRSVLMWHH